MNPRTNIRSHELRLPAKRKLLLIASGVCGIALSGNADLIAHYDFNEGAGATIALNRVAGGSTGTVGTSVVTGVAGIAGNAYQFPDLATQAGIVDMGNASFFSGPSGLNSATALTYSLWMNSTDSDANRNVILFSGSDTVANSYQDLGMSGELNAGINSIDGAAHGRNRPPGAASAQQTGIFSSPVAIHDGNWHHLALTIDLSTAVLSLYVDGALTATQNFEAGAVAFPTFNNFEIGRLGRSGSAVDPYGGLVDDVQVYNQALTEDDVQFLYNNPGLVVPEPSSLALAGLGLLVAAFRKRARKNS